MRALVVYCHPNPQSYCAHLRDVVIAALEQRSAEVRVRDLHGAGFNPVMSCEERLGYHTRGENEGPVAEDLDLLRWCDTLIFVYPTWWFGLPAMLKGWLDRVFVPYATFVLPTEEKGMEPQLTHIVRLVSITSCGASWLQSKFVGEPGRRTVLRGLRHVCNPGCRTYYSALYRIDTSTEAQRKRYAQKVGQLIGRI